MGEIARDLMGVLAQRVGEKPHVFRDIRHIWVFRTTTNCDALRFTLGESRNVV